MHEIVPAPLPPRGMVASATEQKNKLPICSLLFLGIRFWCTCLTCTAGTRLVPSSLLGLLQLTRDSQNGSCSQKSIAECSSGTELVFNDWLRGPVDCVRMWGAHEWCKIMKEMSELPPVSTKMNVHQASRRINSGQHAANVRVQPPVYGVYHHTPTQLPMPEVAQMHHTCLCTAPSQYGRPTASYAPSKPVANTPSMASTAAPSNADYSKGVSPSRMRKGPPRRAHSRALFQTFVEGGANRGGAAPPPQQQRRCVDHGS